MTGSIIGIDIGSQGADRAPHAGRRSPRGRRHAYSCATVRMGARTSPRRSWRTSSSKCRLPYAYVEFVGARPGEGAVGAFAFGRSRGVIEGVCGAAGVPLSFLTPAHWKRLVGIAPGKEGAKDAARSEAIRRWPGHAATFARVKDDGARRGGTDRDRGAHERRPDAQPPRRPRPGRRVGARRLG